MFKKYSVLLIITFVLHLTCVSSAVASTKAEKEAIQAGKVKEAINKLGVGKESRIELKLKDKRKVKGYISEINDDYFVVSDANGASVPVPYPQVQTAKGNNFFGKTFIFTAILIGTLIIIYALASGS